MIKRKGKNHYADAKEDLREELVDYSSANGYVAEHFAPVVCACGNDTFQLQIDEEAGVAVRICSRCDLEHPIGDSAEFLEGAELEQSECLCGSSDFNISVGVALYRNSEAVRWIYIGCFCPKCKLVGCYGDWKNEFDDYRELLKRA